MLRTIASRWSWSLLLAAVALGCSSKASDAPVDAGPDAPAPTLCSSDPRAQTFTPGMEQAGAGGVFKVRLESVQPNPPNDGTNSWTVQVVDAAGAPVVGAAIVVKPFMPDHGHGSSIKPQVQDAGGGRYTVTSLTLAMPGIWQVTFTVTTTDGKTDSAAFTFCIAG